MEVGPDLQRQFDGVLRTYVDRLKKLHNEYATRSSLKGKLRDELYVVLLSLRMQYKTKSPHWVDLADVLNVAYEAQGITGHLDNESVREISRRYEKVHPKQIELYRRHVQRGAFFSGADEGPPQLADKTVVPYNRKKKK